MAGASPGSSVTPRPITFKIFRWCSGRRVSTNACVLGRSSLKRATRLSIAPRDICLAMALSPRWRSVAADDLRGLTGEPHDVQPRVGPVGEVHEAALVRLDVVRLDRHLAAPRAVRHA